jgi:hypothetical protein
MLTLAIQLISTIVGSLHTPAQAITVLCWCLTAILVRLDIVCLMDATLGVLTIHLSLVVYKECRTEFRLRTGYQIDTLEYREACEAEATAKDREWELVDNKNIPVNIPVNIPDLDKSVHDSAKQLLDHHRLM